LIFIALPTATCIFAVTFTVNLPSPSIGAGLRAVRPKLTFRDLSTSIDSRDDCQRHRHASMSNAKASKKRRHQTPYAVVLTKIFAHFFTVTMSDER
jgi:hypothetical protein